MHPHLTPFYRTLCTCLQCGGSFSVPQCYAKRGGGKYCSLSCYEDSRTLESRMRNQVLRSDAPDACWLWQGIINRGGYGTTMVDRRPKLVHRIAWEMVNGPVPDGLLVLHACDVRHCARNDESGVYVVKGVEHPRLGHLWLGTSQDNSDDMAAKGRSMAGVRLPEGRNRGENAPKAKLSEADVMTIRRERAAGVMVKVLAIRYGLTSAGISCVVHGKSWSHLPLIE